VPGAAGEPILEDPDATVKMMLALALGATLLVAGWLYGG
jgi:hypothetical protein